MYISKKNEGHRFVG